MNSQLDVVDFHTHILPGVDHGCDSLETSLRQLKLAKEMGVSRIVLTPHFYPHVDNPEEYVEKRRAEYEALVEALSPVADEYPDIRLGCEVLICEGISKLSQIGELCIKGTKTLLLELPFSDFSKRYIEDVENLISMGYDVILAHADRYRPENIDMLVEVGAKIQLNADSLCSMFLPMAIKRWLKDESVVALGSDIHMLNKTYYKRFLRAMNLLSKKYKNIITCSDKIWDITEK